MEPTSELDTLLERWRRDIFGNLGANPVPILTNIAELIERETEAYLKLPIDPFDDRHPSRAYPDCSLGFLLKSLLKNDNFMSRLTSDYIMSRANFELQVISCRLLLDILPGLDPAVVFSPPEGLVKQLLEWAERAEFPLHSYATGLLGAAMEVPQIFELHREQNNQLVPLMFTRLKQITQLSFSSADQSFDPRDLLDVSDRPGRGIKRPLSEATGSLTVFNECSSSSWAEAHMSGSYQMHPLSTVMQQRFILQYLCALGNYQGPLAQMFEHKALNYILHFIDGRKNQDIRLAFDALRFLAAFLNQRKFALEFLDHGGLPHLLRVSRHGMASSGVSMCLYYLARNDDVLERICWMKREIVERMISYGQWLLECSHDSSRLSAATFFSYCFQFPLLLRLFDRDNGLRKLLNVISMRGLVNDEPLNELTEDELFSRRQTAKQVCIALKKYIRAHFVLENRFTVPTSDQECKPINLHDENVMEIVERHRQQPASFTGDDAIDRLVKEDGLNYLLKMISRISNETGDYALKEKFETVRSALDILVVCSLSPRVQQLLLKGVVRIYIQYPQDFPALAVIVKSADPRILDAHCQKSALNILTNLVCSNYQSSTTIEGSAKKRNHHRNHADLSASLRRSIWDNNATLVLPKLFEITSPLTEADEIRSLACRVLCGLAKEESIQQIISKLPLFTDGQLQALMLKPILTEKVLEHAQFVKYCKQLIELVTGTPVASVSGAEPSLAEIQRRMIVSRTKIYYDESEVFHLIYNYLNSKGLMDSAETLYKEANLSAKPIKALIPVQPSLIQPKSPPNGSSQSFVEPCTPQTPARQPAPQVSTPVSTHLKVNIKTPGSTPLSVSNSRSLLMQKSSLQQPHVYKKLDEPLKPKTITLDSILTDYLRLQHSQCKNPVETCPPFELLAPHRCPEPTNRLSAPRNIASRIMRKKIVPPKGGFNGAKYDRNYIFSKFKPVKVVRDSIDVRTSATCCAFSSDGQFLFVGTDQGMLKAFNIGTGLVEANYECHMHDVGYIESSRNDDLILTTSPDAPSPQCTLWTFTDIFERKQRWDNDLHAEFGKASSDKIITTQELYARLWDTSTGSMLQKFEGHHRYRANRATLNYTDSLVLNDGRLWDVRIANPVHTFVKFNEKINGIFNPNGYEIISNTHIWDLRNFKLLKTVPALDMCKLKFNYTGDVIFATILDDQFDMQKVRNEFKTSFRTFDSHDYSTIATIDLKKAIYDLAVSYGDEHLALVESSGNTRCYHEEYATETNVCRLYEVGRPRYDADIDGEDDTDEDADDEENEDDDDDDDDDDSDDGAGLDYDEDIDDMHYDFMTDDSGDNEEEEEEDAANLHLSSSNSPSSPRDEIVPFRFGQLSEMDYEQAAGGRPRERDDSVASADEDDDQELL